MLIQKRSVIILIAGLAFGIAAAFFANLRWAIVIWIDTAGILIMLHDPESDPLYKKWNGEIEVRPGQFLTMNYWPLVPVALIIIGTIWLIGPDIERIIDSLF